MSPELPEPFVASGARPADAEEVAELIRAVELAQDGEVETTVEDVRDEWSVADLAKDVVLVRDSARLVAYGFVGKHTRGAIADGYVHQSEKGRGLGRFLVRTLEARGRELRLRRVRRSKPK